jgi:integrase
MATANLTQKFVCDIPDLAPGSRKRRFSDKKIAGFFVEQLPSGCKTYRLRYRNRRHRTREITIGRCVDVTCDQARKRVQVLKAEIALGGDPAGELDQLRAVPTFAAFVTDRFVPHIRETIRSYAEYERMLKLRLVPTLGRLQLDQITIADVAGRVNRYLAVLRRALNLALRWELYVGRNPAQSPGMLREEPREVFLAEAQLRALMMALAAEADQNAASAVALLALTGARKAEVLKARWEHVDFERRFLTVPRAKSGQRRHVVLSDAALAVLRLQPRAAGQVFVFPSARLPGTPIEGVRTVWARVKAAAGLPADTRLHDLRHTFASMCVNGNVPLYNVSKLLGHSSQATTTRYAHLRDDTLLEAANAVGTIATGTIEGADAQPHHPQQARPPHAQ